MGWSWAKVSVVAIALAALGGCGPDQDDDPDDERLQCNLTPNTGYRVTVKGTAQYTTEVSGDAVVAAINYGDGQEEVYVADPKQPFSATVELEVGDQFHSASYGYLMLGSISARDVFTPADGSAIAVHEQTCWTGLTP